MNNMKVKMINKREKATLNKMSADERRREFTNWVGESDGSISRILCCTCGLVTEEGHSCSVMQTPEQVGARGTITKQTDDWCGDALLMLDVRLGIGRSTGRIDNAQAIAHTSNARLKQYLLDKGVVLHDNASDSSYGTVFESMYRGSFRREYLESIFGNGAHITIEKSIARMIGSNDE